jgi:hypothetical protein
LPGVLLHAADPPDDAPLGDWEITLPWIPGFDGSGTGEGFRLVPRPGPIFLVPPEAVPSAPMRGERYQMVGEFPAISGTPSGIAPTSPRTHWSPVTQLEVRLNQLFYQPAEQISPELLIHNGQLAAPELGLVLVAPQSHDLEVLTVNRAEHGTRYAAAAGLIVSASNPGGAVTKLDGWLSLQPNETFFAFYYPDPNRDRAVWHGEQVVADFGIMLDAGFPGAAPQVVPDLALTQDELAPPPGAKKVGTLLYGGGLPVQVATEELIIHPRDDAELAEFLEATGGQIVLTDLLAGERATRGPPSLYLVRVNLETAKPERLPQMLAAFGQTTRPLRVSSPDVPQCLDAWESSTTSRPGCPSAKLIKLARAGPNGSERAAQTRVRQRRKAAKPIKGASRCARRIRSTSSRSGCDRLRVHRTPGRNGRQRPAPGRSSMNLGTGVGWRRGSPGWGGSTPSRWR